MATVVEKDPETAVEPVYRKIAVYLLLTFGSSAVFDYLMVSQGGMHSRAGLFVFPLMWCPGISAMLTQLIFSRSLRGMGWGWGKTRYQLVSFLLPLAYSAVAYGVVWASGLAPLSDARIFEKLGQQLENAGIRGLGHFTVLAIYLAIMLTVGTVLNCAAAMGEEIGWRGFLVPQLAKVRSYTQTSLISGLVWSVWHYPILLFAGYTNEGLPSWYALVCFTTMVVGISFAFAWLRLKSGSLWTGVLAHASHNLFIQGVFTPLTTQTAISKYLIDEFGAALAITSLIVAFLFWRRRGELG
jgi:membrane protease YdiL (CAAX protease family)